MPDKEITIRQRMAASAELAQAVDKKVRTLSQYGDKTTVAFDETMAYAGIAHAFATWWEHMSDEQINTRLVNLVNSTKAALVNRRAERGAAATSTSTH